ncbi:hypothetical protein H4R18_003150, partial [Coemansia javaensis]
MSSLVPEIEVSPLPAASPDNTGIRLAKAAESIVSVEPDVDEALLQRQRELEDLDGSAR